MASRPDSDQQPRHNQQDKGLEGRRFTPSQFMRARRPEKFSDSYVVHEPLLTREVFEYHLDTLTNRKQETEFEHFCRRLAEKELCPNLRPQTGPTGGGDSKVDAESYLVADDIAIRWYEGVGREPARERWAFAFSAKKDWRSKVSSDVRGIIETRREYKQIYFVTNQFAPDKARAKSEDELTRTHGVPVTILDRTWIVKCVFEHKHFRIAADALGLTAAATAVQRVIGPRDAERETALMELDKEIADADRYRGVKYQLAEDCLQSALLARGLERPRAEVEQRLARAERIAEEVGHSHQRLRVAYNTAWSAIWWFDDLDQMSRIYEIVEKLAIQSNQANDLELLTNLYMVLSSAVVSGRLDKQATKLETRERQLMEALGRIAADTDRPNNALQARTSLVLMELQHAVAHRDRLDAALNELQNIIAGVQGLLAYPLEPLVKIVVETGEWLTNNPLYDRLLEDLIGIMQTRVSNAEAGRILLERGFQKLRGEQTYDAIRLFGRAWQKLAVRECRDELIAALLGCGMAYAVAGLPWAARASVLAAVNQAFSDFVEEGSITPLALMCVQKMVWAELQLGRVPHVLQWMDVALATAQPLILRADRKKEFFDEREDQDRVFSILLLKADLPGLESICFLPPVLENLGLNHSWMTLLYALGYEVLLRSEGVIPESEGSEAIRDLFGQMTRLPAAQDLPDRPELLDGESITLRSHVLGCAVAVHADNSLLSLFLGEQILGSLEGLLATSLETRMFPHAEDFYISVELSPEVKGLPQYDFNEGRGGNKIRIRRGPEPEDQPLGRNGVDWLAELVLKIVPRIAVVEDLESYARQVFGEEAGLTRAFSLSDPSVPLTNVLGRAAKLRMSDWRPQADAKEFPLRRDVPWNDDLPKSTDAPEAKNEPRIESGRPPREFFSFDRMKHRDVQVVSVINMHHWDRARWRGILYLFSGQLDELAIMSLGFSDRAAAQLIFQEWIDRFGTVDKDEQLRIAVITGVSKSYPSRYRVIVGSKFDPANVTDLAKHFILTARVQQMDPADSRNLDGFLLRYSRLSRYFIAPAYLPEPPESPTVFYKLCIGKRELTVRPAWQIGENDPDAFGLAADDDPTVPEGVANPPFVPVLERIRKSGKRFQDFPSG